MLLAMIKERASNMQKAKANCKQTEEFIRSLDLGRFRVVRGMIELCHREKQEPGEVQMDSLAWERWLMLVASVVCILILFK